MESLTLDKILNGPCEELLKTIPDDSVNGIATDPPYGLGTREPTGEDIDRYLRGAALDTGGDFMGAAWEIPSVAVWKECYRILKPGGYLLAFAGTRTWDIMSVGIRAAGFENRDTVANIFGSPCLQWLHSQGFPKSLNIAKRLRAMGVAEEIAKQWDGWGTALKPAWEPILCFRKPVIESVPAQIAATGTGGINIGGTRVEHASAADFQKHKEQVDRIREKGGSWGDSWKNVSDLSGANEVSTAGRWPANATLSHTEECTKTEHGYVCVDGCAVKALGEQHKDAAKYFAQFIPDAPFYYTGKASKTEKNLGIAGKFSDGFVELRKDLSEEELTLFKNHWPSNYPDPTVTPVMLEAVLEISEEFVKLFQPVKPESNSHPTVKPIALMRWLVRMIAPRHGVVLDPYCGSGTTCAAAVEEGIHFIGIDRDPLFAKLAEKRVSYLLEKSTFSQQETLEFLSSLSD